MFNIYDTNTKYITCAEEADSRGGTHGGFSGRIESCILGCGSQGGYSDGQSSNRHGRA